MPLTQDKARQVPRTWSVVSVDVTVAVGSLSSSSWLSGSYSALALDTSRRIPLPEALPCRLSMLLLLVGCSSVSGRVAQALRSICSTVQLLLRAAGRQATVMSGCYGHKEGGKRQFLS